MDNRLIEWWCYKCGAKGYFESAAKAETVAARVRTLHKQHSPKCKEPPKSSELELTPRENAA